MPIWLHWLWNTGLRYARQTVILRGFAVCVGLTRFPHPEMGKRPRFARALVGWQSDPHHLRYVQPPALGRKARDEFAVPLCRSHHRAVHRAGDEQVWWKAAGIDPVKVTQQLWWQTRLDDPQEHHQGVSGRARRLDQLPRPLTIRGNRGPIRLP